MAIVETVVVGFVVALLLLLAWAIGRRGKVGLLAVDAWTGAVPRPGVLVTLLIVASVGWFLWKWNASERDPD
jgi:hypothetical protein